LHSRPARATLNLGTGGSMMPLAQEHSFFKSHHDEIVKGHLGEYVVIKGDKVMGYYKGMFDGCDDMVAKNYAIGTFANYRCTKEFPTIEIANVWTV
jgi:hypothetical protein